MERLFINIFIYLYRKPKNLAIHLTSQTAFYLVLPRQLEWNLPSLSIYIYIYMYAFFSKSPPLHQALVFLYPHRVSKSPSYPQFICPKHQSKAQADYPPGERTSPYPTKREVRKTIDGICDRSLEGLKK